MRRKAITVLLLALLCLLSSVGLPRLTRLTGSARWLPAFAVSAGSGGSILAIFNPPRCFLISLKSAVKHQTRNTGSQPESEASCPRL